MDGDVPITLQEPKIHRDMAEREWWMGNEVGSNPINANLYRDRTHT